jgi:hypothetical protein
VLPLCPEAGVAVESFDDHVVVGPAVVEEPGDLIAGDRVQLSGVEGDVAHRDPGGLGGRPAPGYE